ncbi:hypothetical protein ACFVT1_08540 [Streptomyces sp. NPDC057963]|uniref:hypothetical protein n=1 Tax=Streptomyces sp. NPDC057963 TaxID=3346290 RepID=UPI0036ECBF17
MRATAITVEFSDWSTAPKATDMLHDDMADIAAGPVLDFAAIHRGLPVTVTQ